MLLKEMARDGEKMGADAILGVYITSSAVVGGAAELVAYGTAVKLK